MRKVLGKEFFNRPTYLVAEELLGKYIVQPRGSKYKITEVEVYDGFEDKASHAHKGKTKRNEIMFGEAGKFYVYLVYGMHYMLNVVTGPVGYPSAILIRGVEQISGPARLTKALQIDRRFNGKEAHKKSKLWFEDGGEVVHKKEIKKTARIGVDYAGPIWSKKKYRFVLVRYI